VRDSSPCGTRGRAFRRRFCLLLSLQLSCGGTNFLLPFSKHRHLGPPVRDLPFILPPSGAKAMVFFFFQVIGKCHPGLFSSPLLFFFRLHGSLFGRGGQAAFPRYRRHRRIIWSFSPLCGGEGVFFFSFESFPPPANTGRESFFFPEGATPLPLQILSSPPLPQALRHFHFLLRCNQRLFLLFAILLGWPNHPGFFILGCCPLFQEPLPARCSSLWNTQPRFFFALVLPFLSDLFAGRGLFYFPLPCWCSGNPASARPVIAPTATEPFFPSPPIPKGSELFFLELGLWFRIPPSP